MIKVYTDGACAPTNPGHGGLAFVCILEDGTVETHCESYQRTTNNRMELMAVVRVLEKFRGVPVHIFSDSTYVVAPISSGSLRSRTNDYLRKKPNSDLWIRVKELLTSSVKCTWVRGHNGNKYNEMADKLSYDVINNSRKRVDHGYTK
jgi:ribonuclease HI